jgi:hypothetical protein
MTPFAWWRSATSHRCKPAVELLENRLVPTTGDVLLPAFYHDLLGRLPGAAAAGFVAQIDQGVAPAAVAYQIETGPGNEYRLNVAADDYLRLLHRPGSAAELSMWANQLAVGLTQQQLEAALVGSAEYYTLHGGTTAGFLNGLYVDALARPDSEGAWIDLVNRGADRQIVAYAVFTSPEGALQQVQADFERYLRRSGTCDPSAAGFARELLQSASNESIVAALLGSAEYLARQPSLPAEWWNNGSSNSVLLPAFYWDLLDRAPDASAAGFAAQFLQGADPAVVAREIETSPEYRLDVAADDYLRLLHRQGSTVELSMWANQLAAGLTQQQLEAALVGSHEYYTLHGGTSAGFLNGLYVDALARPDSEGAWIDLVNRGADRQSVAYAVLTSPEGALQQVQADFERYLRRSDIGTAGAAGFARELLQGASIESITAALLGSPEYFNRQPPLPVDMLGGGTDTWDTSPPPATWGDTGGNSSPGSVDSSTPTDTWSTTQGDTNVSTDTWGGSTGSGGVWSNPST